jgi:uncharacterized protein YqjF (DUF2071 family)/predicted DCC family thiol-disulfide oxidoreductase YuxK
MAVVDGWVLYDEGCGVCARWVPFWAPTLRRIGLDVAPLQAPWVAARLGMAPDALVRDIRLLLSDGRQLAGADVYRYVMRRIWWTRPVAALADAPALRDVFDRAYRAFADSRLGISHACGLGPTATAPRSVFLTAAWRDLVMLNYDVDPAVLAPLVPAGTSLDLWQGRALVSVVGFRFLATRVLGVAVPWHRNFDEVNLRFYVRREGDGGPVRRGVVFIRELVARPAITLLARLAYNEPYRTVPMRSTASEGGVSRRLTYEWRLGDRWHRLAASVTGTAAVPAPESEAAFVTQRHWGYSRRRDGGTFEYAVEHPPWRVWSADTPVLDADIAALWGPELVSPLARPPASAFVAEGSPVAVLRPRRLVAGVGAAPSPV